MSYSSSHASFAASSVPAPAPESVGRARRAVAVWLIVCAAMVFAMAIIGAITRLTGSGLSMVEWRPLIGALPPLSETEWQRVFDLYRQSPEYRHVNAGMTLDDFKLIFFWEWFHRLWGRLIGLVFVVPFLWFWLRGRIPRPLLPKLVGLLALGGLQGVIGWWMVASGLVDRPAVSHYRLAVHLSLAFLIYALLLWVAWGLLEGRRERLPPTVGTVRRHGWAALALLSVTIVWGAMVAGIDAGLAYNSFPLMHGHLLPPEAWTLVPTWVNFFENTALVQFTHRWLGIATALTVLALWARVERAAVGPRVRRLARWAALAAVAQASLGIATLLLAVPLTIATLHQAGALGLLTVLLWLAFSLRRAVPSAHPLASPAPFGPAQAA